MQNTPLVGSSKTVHVYYPFHAHAGCDLKSEQQWRVSKDYIIVGLSDGSRLKLPTWMTSGEAATFKVTEFPTVSLDALMVVSESIPPAELVA
jgi:hypothetical protein